MKKILLTLLALILVASFASCGALKTEKVINDAIENTSKLTEFEAKMDMVIDMSMTGMTMNVPMNISMKVKDADKENPIVWANMSTSVLGEAVEMESYMDKDYVYLVSDGEGCKMSIDETDDEYDYTDDVNDILQKLPVDLIKDTELIKENGTFKITVNIPDGTFKEIFDDLIDSMSEASLGEFIGDFDISDCVVTVTVKDDYVTNYDISYKMSMTANGVKIDSSVTAKVEYVNPGQSVTITPPDGYENFELAY